VKFKGHMPWSLMSIQFGRFRDRWGDSRGRRILKKLERERKGGYQKARTATKKRPKKQGRERVGGDRG